ncbi:hypothetical protein MMC19_006149 [Ptychographa xylographoides]|nr:hypothetical protein [Ptychographa xylographoides]
MSSSMSAKFANPATQLEVDEAILEYLVFTGIARLLDCAKARLNGPVPAIVNRHAELSVQMADSFLIIFRTNHPEAHGSRTIQFRLSLLRFVVIFTGRFVASETSLSAKSLEKIRSAHRARAEAFRFHCEITDGVDLSSFSLYLPFSEQLQIIYRKRMLDTFAPQDTELDYYGSPQSLSLLDTLPLFMALSASQTALQGRNVAAPWMHLAASYMAEAVLEQFLCFSAADAEPIWEAFSYGFDVDSTAEAGSDELAITNMFWGGVDESEVGGWKEIKEGYLAAVLPPKGCAVLDHLVNLEASELPLLDFENGVVDFLTRLLDAQSLPLLIQLERGNVEGISVL